MFVTDCQMVDVCDECQCTSTLFDDLLTPALTGSHFNAFHNSLNDLPVVIFMRKNAAHK